MFHRNRKSLKVNQEKTRDENGDHDNQEKKGKSQKKKKKSKSGMDAESIARFMIGQLSSILGFFGLKQTQLIFFFQKLRLRHKFNDWQ